jgi:hypothetical protein
VANYIKIYLINSTKINFNTLPLGQTQKLLFASHVEAIAPISQEDNPKVE